MKRFRHNAVIWLLALGAGWGVWTVPAPAQAECVASVCADGYTGCGPASVECCRRPTGAIPGHRGSAVTSSRAFPGLRRRVAAIEDARRRSLWRRRPNRRRVRRRSPGRLRGRGGRGALLLPYPGLRRRNRRPGLLSPGAAQSQPLRLPLLRRPSRVRLRGLFRLPIRRPPLNPARQASSPPPLLFCNSLSETNKINQMRRGFKLARSPGRKEGCPASAGGRSFFRAIPPGRTTASRCCRTDPLRPAALRQRRAEPQRGQPVSISLRAPK